MRIKLGLLVLVQACFSLPKADGKQLNITSTEKFLSKNNDTHPKQVLQEKTLELETGSQSQAKKLFVAFNGMKPKDVPKKSPDSVRISVIGDSITNGLGHWPQKLADLINSPYIEIADFGASGSTISQSAFKNQPFKPYRYTDQWEMFKVSDPDIVMFMLGSCDSKLENWAINSRQNFEEEYYHWLEYFTQMQPPPKKVYAMIPPPILPCVSRNKIDHMGVQIVNDFFPSKIPDLVYRLNTAPDTDKRPQVEIIDIFGFMGGHDMKILNNWCKDPKIDGFHYGFDKIAESVYTYLSVTLNMDLMHEFHRIEERGWLKEGERIWKAGAVLEKKKELGITGLPVALIQPDSANLTNTTVINAQTQIAGVSNQTNVTNATSANI